LIYENTGSRMRDRIIKIEIIFFIYISIGYSIELYNKFNGSHFLGSDGKGVIKLGTNEVRL
ncbi:MAG: hypothetical protein ACTSQQ_13040, partial [Candidatus Helarchaeota archaeon]